MKIIKKRSLSFTNLVWLKIVPSGYLVPTLADARGIKMRCTFPLSLTKKYNIVQAMTDNFG
jgi:hypothetical protein